MARIPDIERRLLNWARWKISSTSGSIGFAQPRYEERVDGEGWDAQARIPTSDCEADETQEAIDRLQAPLPETLVQVYVKGRGMRDKAAALGCTERTVYARVDQAHRELASYFSAKAEAADLQRARVEALQRLATARR